MLYSRVIRPLARKMNREKAMNLVFGFYRVLAYLPLGRQLIHLLYKRDYPSLHHGAFGLDFTGPVALGAGFDPQGKIFDLLLDAGFAYVQVGPFSGKADIFQAIEHLKGTPHNGIVAACLAERNTLDEQVVKDYDTAFTLLYDFVDMFIVRIDQPDIDLDIILNKRMCMDVYKPVLFHLSDELNRDDLADILRYAQLSGVDGVVVGRPDYDKTLAMLKDVQALCQGRMPVVAAGGIYTPEQAAGLLQGGAVMVELYDGILEQGPTLLRKILKYLNKNNKNI